MDDASAELRAALVNARTVVEAETVCSLAVRKTRWVPDADRAAVLDDIGEIIAEVAMISDAVRALILTPEALEAYAVRQGAIREGGQPF